MPDTTKQDFSQAEVDEYKKYVEAFRRLRKKRVDQKELVNKAYQTALECTKRLVEEFGAKEVYLFGSLAKGVFVRGSDIDLAVKGIPFRKYLKAGAELMSVNGFEIDLIDWENSGETLKTRIEEEKYVLFDGKRVRVPATENQG